MFHDHLKRHKFIEISLYKINNYHNLEGRHLIFLFQKKQPSQIQKALINSNFYIFCNTNFIRNFLKEFACIYHLENLDFKYRFYSNDFLIRLQFMNQSYSYCYYYYFYSYYHYYHYRYFDLVQNFFLKNHFEEPIDKKSYSFLMILIHLIILSANLILQISILI